MIARLRVVRVIDSALRATGFPPLDKQMQPKKGREGKKLCAHLLFTDA